MASDAGRRACGGKRWRNSPASPSLRRLIESLEHPAYITGSRWDVLAWNKAAADMLTDFDKIAEDECNILLYALTDPKARKLFGSTWEEEAQRMVAQFRATYDLWSRDPAFSRLLERLKESAEFNKWWGRHDIRTGGAGRKHLHHPERGDLVFDYATFQANENPALKLAIYTPVLTASGRFAMGS